MEESKQELKPKTRRKPVRKEKIVEPVQTEQKPVAPITNTKQQPAISEIEVAKKLININAFKKYIILYSNYII